MDDNPIVFVVDDDQAVRDGVSDLVESMDLEAQSFASAEEFVQAHKPDRPACLLLDVRMPGMSGMELLKYLAEEGTLIPTIIVTGHGDIPMTVEALETGAVDFVEKPFREQDLWAKIRKALGSAVEFKNAQTQRANLKNSLSLLTSKELKTLRSLVTGKSDKQIASELGVSRRSATFYRTSILDKMATTTVVELTSLLARSNIQP